MDSFNIFDPNRRDISGPTNALRLEGEVDGIPKVIYLFMDVHMPVESQTECANIHSQDFPKYLIDSFYKLSNSDLTYDFFYEITASAIKVSRRTRVRAAYTNVRSGPRKKYIERVLPLMRSIVEYDKDSNRFGTSKIFKNIRLHYMDIREFFIEAIFIPLTSLPIPQCFHNFDISPQLFTELTRIRRTINQVVSIYEIVSTTKDQPTIDNPIVPLLRKLLYSYKHSQVQDMITQKLAVYMKQFSELSENIQEALVIFQEHYHTLHNRSISYIRDSQIGEIPSIPKQLEIFSDVHVRVSNMIELAGYIAMGITDCYTLRRFLDKDYITNAIVYAGGSHIVGYIIALVGNQGFKITHIANTVVPSIPELNKTVLDRISQGIQITDLFIRPEYLQCIDITDFPDQFL